MKIKILGAGVAGLTTAIALKKKGFDVGVYERHEGRSDIGAGIVCWPNASFVLKELGLLEDIALQSGVPVKMRRLSNKGNNLGALDIVKLNETMGYPSFSILRKDLMKVLESHLTEYGIEVKYGNAIKKLVSTPSGSTSIHFENGATHLQKFTKIRFPKTTSIAMGARQFASSLFSTDKNVSEQRNRNSMNTDYNSVISGMAKGWSIGLPLSMALYFNRE